MSEITTPIPKIDVTQADIDNAIKDNNSFVNEICQDVKTVYRALNDIAVYTKDSDFIDKRTRKIEKVISKMSREMVYLQTQLSILECKTNTEVPKNTPSGTNRQVCKAASNTMDELLGDIWNRYLFLPYINRGQKTLNKFV